jgi:hypothetical protein
LNAPFPVAVLAGQNLGLGAAGDDLDGLSSANTLFTFNAPFVLLFSVSRDTVGVAPPDPALVALGFPYNVLDQAARGHQAGDEYMSTSVFTLSATGGRVAASDGNNTLERNNYDEGGSDLSARPETSAQTMAVGAPQDNVDALADEKAATGPYFSVTAGSPALTTLPGAGSPSGANIFRYNLIQITLFASYTQLGLQQSDDVDAIVVFDTDANGVFSGNDRILFSLTPGSPSLATMAGASVTGAAADVFIVAPGQAPALFVSASGLGLGAEADDIDGLRVVLCPDALLCVTEHAIRLEVISIGTPTSIARIGPRSPKHGPIQLRRQPSRNAPGPFRPRHVGDSWVCASRSCQPGRC